MSRSSGFGSTPSNYVALFGLGFPAPALSLKLATECKSLTHYTKGTPSPLLNEPSKGSLSRSDALRFAQHVTQLLITNQILQIRQIHRICQIYFTLIALLLCSH